MRYHWLFLVSLLSLPVSALATGMPQGAPASAPPSENVEEPDAPDETPDKEMQGSAIPGESEENAQKIKSEEKPPVQEAAPEGDANYDRVMLQVLNKVTARAEAIEAPIGSVVRFGTIEIVVHSCWKSSPEERPENAAMLEISEIKQGEAPTQIFLGWMFSSTPGLSALENPFYDVAVVKCEKAAEVQAPAAPAAKPAAKKTK